MVQPAGPGARPVVPVPAPAVIVGAAAAGAVVAVGIGAAVIAESDAGSPRTPTRDERAPAMDATAP